MTALDDRLSASHTAKGRLQRALLDQLGVHERDGTLPTSSRFLFYELVQAGVVPKAATGVRRADQNLIDALTFLREAGLVAWDAIEDETRTLHEFQTAPTVAAYVADAAQYASIDRWDGRPAPLVLCESRSLAGVLYGLATRYACPIASTNGQCRGFLITKVAPRLQPGQRVLYLGDWDRGGHQIEAANHRTLLEYGSHWVGDRHLELEYLSDNDLWERVALTTAQVEEHNLPIIKKLDRRYRGNGVRGQHFDAVETEAFGQANIVAALRDRLDALMPEPLVDVLERQERQRVEVTEQLTAAGGAS